MTEKLLYSKNTGFEACKRRKFPLQITYDEQVIITTSYGTANEPQMKNKSDLTFTNCGVKSEELY